MTGNPTKYTPSEALRLVAGLHRKRLYAMMKTAEISYELVQGRRVLDGVELARVFGGNFAPQDTKETEKERIKKHNETETTSAEIFSLQQEIAVLREQHRGHEALLHEKERLIDQLSRERDAWREQAQMHTRLLTESRAQETLSWWRRLFDTRP
jgi:DNA gyrase/topoisomerase IV subunit A